MTENVTVAGRDAPSVTEPGKHTFKDLPVDVQDQIEHYCSENNNGERAASHSRQAMTERALHYQRLVGKTDYKGIDRAKLQAEADKHLEVSV